MFRLTYKNPGETSENDFSDYPTQKEAVAMAETPWEEGTEVFVWKLIKKGTAKSVTEWED
jgi:hypothetical protein